MMESRRVAYDLWDATGRWNFLVDVKEFNNWASPSWWWGAIKDTFSHAYKV